MHRLERTFVLSNRSEQIDSVVDEIKAEMRRVGVGTEDDVISVGLALSETLANAMIHGNLSLPGSLLDGGYDAFRKLVETRREEQPYRDRRIYVQVKASDEVTVCSVRDEGDGFDPDALPDPRREENIERIHGRGLLLVKAFMDDVRFNSRGNEVTIVRKYRRAA